MTDIDPKVREYFRKLGKKGGSRTREIHGPEYFSNMAKSKKGMKWSWAPEKKGPRNKKAKDLQKSKEGAKVK